MARPLGDIDMMPLWAALAGHAHAVWVAVLAPASARQPLPIEVLHRHQQLIEGAVAWKATESAIVKRLMPLQLMQALLWHDWMTVMPPPAWRCVSSVTRA